MKKLLLLLPFYLLFTPVFAQSPALFNYQGVARDAGGNVLANQAIGLQMDVRQTTPTGIVVYSETHAATTNAFGLFNIKIGGGTPQLGTLGGIDWGNGPYFTEVSLDATGGTSYVSMGVSQLLSVPYALYAENSGTAGPAGVDGVDGATGPTGADGINGTNGVDGVTGATGLAGTNGTDGATGATGATGSAGTNGLDGATGATGATGLAGTNGTDGATGATGATGSAGTNGLDGTDGINGTNGTDGVDGTDGATGATGATGLAGTNGVDGVDGATGSTGLAGTNGLDGATGATGATGLAGTNGLDGTTGPTGPAGDAASGNTLDEAYDQGGAGLGNVITATDGAVSIEGQDGFQVTGTYGSGDAILLSGADARMFFNPKKAAFRAGYVNAAQWDNTNVGSYSAAMGGNTEASGNYSFAMGYLATASGNYSIALGDQSTASGEDAIAFGDMTIASGNRSTAISGGTASGFTSIAIGDNTASGDRSLALGFLSEASGTYSSVMGFSGNAIGEYSTVIGTATASGEHSLAMVGGNASGKSSTAMGITTAKSFAEMAIGRNNTTYTPNNTLAWDPGDRLFVVGNGANGSARSNAMVILKNGNTGFGISIPTAKLDVVGTVKIADGSQGAGKVLSSDANGLASWVTLAVGSTLDASYDFGGAGAGNTINATDGAVSIAGQDGFQVTGSFGVGDDILLSGAGTRMFFNPKKAAFRVGSVSAAQWNNASVGNYSVAMGYNTTAPSYAETAIGSYSTTYTPVSTNSWNAADRLFVIGNGVSATPSDAMVVLKNGKTGFGTATPEANVHVRHTGDASIWIEGDANNVGEDDNAWLKITQDGGAIGSIIGHTGAADVDPEGNAYADALINSLLIGTTTDGAPLQLGTNDAARLTINSIGFVGIGTNTPIYALEVNGSAGKPGGGSWVNTSDKRLKQDVKPYTDGLQQLLAIKPITYHYNEKSGFDTKPEYVGVLAQDLKEVAPYMVGTYDKEGSEFYNVDNSAMTYMLINAVQELKEIVDRQQKEIEALKK